MTKLLLERNANPNALSDTGLSPFDLVVSSPGHLNFVKNLLFKNTILAEVVQSRPDDLQPEHAPVVCSKCSSIIRSLQPAYSCNMCSNFTLCDPCIWYEHWCADHQHVMQSNWRHLDFSSQHPRSVLGLLPSGLCQEGRTSSMLALLRRFGAMASRDMAIYNHNWFDAPGIFDFDTEEPDQDESEDDEDDRASGSDSEDSVSTDLLIHEFLTRRRFLSGLANSSSRKRRFSSDSETSRA